MDRNTWILILALAVSVLSLTAAVIVCLCYRRMLRSKNRDITHAMHRQDHLLRELEQIRIEKETIERIIKVLTP